MRKRTWTDEQMVDAVAHNKSIAGILRQLRLYQSAGNYNSVHSACRRLGLDTSHWTGQAHLKGQHHNFTKRTPLADILVEGSTFNNGNLKERLLQEMVKENRCESCGQLPRWQGQPLTIELDHINGIHSDNRIENLRMLCPNCHSQTKTFSRKNAKTNRLPKEQHLCSRCGKRLRARRKTGMCVGCCKSAGVPELA